MNKDQSPETLVSLRAKAVDFAKTHLQVIAVELVEWHSTGLLGEGKMRELAAMCEQYSSSDEAMSVAEFMVNDLAIKVIANSSDAPVGYADAEEIERLKSPMISGRACFINKQSSVRHTIPLFTRHP